MLMWNKSLMISGILLCSDFYGILLAYIFVFPNIYDIEEYAGEMNVEKRKKTDREPAPDT